MSADDRVDQSGAVLIIAQPVLVSRHTLEAQCVDRSQIGVAFGETLRIKQVRDSLLRRLRKVIVAAGTNALVLRELDLVHNIGAAGALLPQTLRHLALATAHRLQRWSFENSHLYARAAVAACTESAPLAFRTRAHSLSVDPVVRMSSIKSTRKPRTFAFFRKRKASRKFSMRSARSNAVWVVV